MGWGGCGEWRAGVEWVWWAFDVENLEVEISRKRAEELTLLLSVF